jgi:hypothetical protein
MLLHQPLPLFFADADGIITIIAILIGAIGWIVKVISNANQAGPPVGPRGRPPVRPRDERLSQEINVFLEETAKPGGKRSAPSQARPQQRPPAARSGKRPPQPPKPPEKKPPRRLVPGEEVAQRHLEPKRDLGENVRKHVETHLADNAAKEVSQHMKSRIGESVAEHLGSGGSVGQTAPAAAPLAPAQSLVKQLRNPATIRQAMILNMVLTRPRSLERKS